MIVPLDTSPPCRRSTRGRRGRRRAALPRAGQLLACSAFLAQPPGPVGNQRTVGRTGDRVLVDTRRGREEARNKIAVAAGRRDETAKASSAAMAAKSGRRSRTWSSSLVDDQQIAGAQCLQEGRAQDLRQPVTARRRARAGGMESPSPAGRPGARPRACRLLV